MSDAAIVDWLRATGRARFAVICVCFTLGVAWLVFILWGMALPGEGVTTARELRGVAGGDAGTFHIAGRFTLEGRAADAYDPARHGAAWVALGGRPKLGRAYWAYPPPFLLAVAPLGLFDARTGILVWLAAMGAASVAAVAVAARDWRAALPAIFVPTAVHGVAVGQNGGLTALLLALVFTWRERRPRAAGVALGLFAFKPQLGLAAGFLFLARRRWETLAAAAATAAALALLATIALGPGIWPAFLAVARASADALVDFGLRTDRLTTVYGMALALGLPVAAAAALQAAAAGAALWLMLRAMRPGGDEVAAALALAAAGVLVTPYAFEYDFTVFALPLGVLFARWLAGRAPDWWDILVFAYAMLIGPAMAMTYAVTLFQPGAFAVFAGLGLAVALARARSAAVGGLDRPSVPRHQSRRR